MHKLLRNQPVHFNIYGKVGKNIWGLLFTCIGNVGLLSKVKKAAGMEDSFFNESQGQENKPYMCEAEKGFFFLNLKYQWHIPHPFKMVLESKMFTRK